MVRRASLIDSFRYPVLPFRRDMTIMYYHSMAMPEPRSAPNFVRGQSGHLP